MTPPPLDFPVPVAEELLGEDWFGEGSVFDTGEDLASALMALAGGRMEWPVAPVALDFPSASLEARPAAHGPLSAPRPRLEPAAEFQVATMPSSRGGDPSGWGPRPAAVSRRRWSAAVSGAERRGWSIRQSVQLLRVTEQILTRLREEAAQLTWQLAAAAHRETDA